MNSLPKIETILLLSTIPGALGGIAAFLLALLKDEYKNNKYIRKFIIEILGAMITASFVSIIIKSSEYQPIISFALGVGWASVIQIIRIKITKIVEATFGEINTKK